MTTPEHVVMDAYGPFVQRAEAIAKAMNADPEMTQEGEWTVDDVLTAAISGGLDTMERLHIKGDPS